MLKTTTCARPAPEMWDNADVLAGDNADVFTADNADVFAADNADVLAADTTDVLAADKYVADGKAASGGFFRQKRRSLAKRCVF